MTGRERVIAAIEFKKPDRLPVWLINKDQKQGDVLWYDFRIPQASGGQVAQGNILSEFGYVWRTLNDGTMGHPTKPVIGDWSQLEGYKFPDINPDVRLKTLNTYLKESEGYYRLPMLMLTGFNTFTFLRGFENSMSDFVLEYEKASYLLDGIFSWEEKIITLAAENGFDGFHFGDDWGTQNGMIISSAMWRDIFKPRYKKIFDHAHNSGLHVWFHCCGNFDAIIDDLHEVGVDVINIAQPNVVDLEGVSQRLKGKQCFLIPISYQSVGISGTPEEIIAEGKRITDLFHTEAGGLVGYAEEYGCMGMTDENFEACKAAFGIYKNGNPPN